MDAVAGLLVEAVAREVGLALHTAELLEENRLRLAGRPRWCRPPR